MKKTSLSATGLSMSQAQSISNLCYQGAKNITDILSSVNNAEKALKLHGELFYEQKGCKMPDNVIELLKEKAALHATQAFLMENIKAKDDMLKALKLKQFESPLPYPQKPEYATMLYTDLVDESWGWEQLSLSEYNEYLEAEAYASHIGQFIHKGGKLDTLRKELATIKTLEFISLRTGEQTPLHVTVHHKAHELLDIHNELAAGHRYYEQRVNYFKAKVKNLVSDENARISKENADKLAEVNAINSVLEDKYLSDLRQYHDETKKLTQEFEQFRQEETKRIAQLRITVDPRFQEIVDKYLNDLK